MIISRQTWKKKMVFVCVLKTNDENSRIRIHLVKAHGSATLLTGFRSDQVLVNSLSTHLPLLAENSAENWLLLQVLDILLQLLSEEGLVLLNNAV